MPTDAEAQKAMGVLLTYKRRNFTFYRTVAILTGVIFAAMLSLATLSGDILSFIQPAVWLLLTIGMLWKAYQNWKWIKDE